MRTDNDLFLLKKLKKALTAAIEAKDSLLKSYEEELTEKQKERIEKINKEIKELQQRIDSIS